MKLTTPTQTDRLNALVAFVRKDEKACGYPEAELCTAERFEAASFDTFANKEAPHGVFYFRVVTKAEANAYGIPECEQSATFINASRKWVVIDTTRPAFDPLDPSDGDRKSAYVEYMDGEVDNEKVVVDGSNVNTTDNDSGKWVLTLAELLDAGVEYHPDDLFTDASGVVWVISAL